MMWLLVFLLACVVDWVWARYIKTTAEGKALASAVWAAGVVLAGAAITICYVGDHWRVLPAAAGAFVGTWLAHKQVAILNLWNCARRKLASFRDSPTRSRS